MLAQILLRSRTVRLFAVLAAGVLSAVGGPYDAPAGYYDSATGVGATLQSQLHDLIDNHEVFSYGDARSILQITDQDPNDPDRMLLVYTRESLDVSVINPGGSIPGWDSGVTWNREHTWPRSRGVDSSGPDNSDLHQLRPSDPGVNNSRGNKNFGGSYGDDYGAVSGTDYWYPGDADAPMIARQQFYMAVRYDVSDGSTNDLVLASGDTNAANQLGDLDALIDWHYRAAPDDFERRRNHLIYEDYQENRIPFVDHPEWVWSVFVDQANDTQLSLAGSTPAADGSSTTSIDLGRTYVGQAGPSTQTVSITKSGDDGTYFGVTTTGAATTNAGEYSRPLALGAGVSDSFDVGLDVSTATSDVFTGNVVVDNLDITASGGSGVGANDADDVIDLTFTVVDHPIASLAADAITSEITIDFGQIEIGENIVEEVINVFNYAGTGAPTLAADLDLSNYLEGLDSQRFPINFTASDGLMQGESATVGFDLDTSEEGSFETTYTLVLDGEDLPGALTQSLDVTLLAEVVAPALTGDYNSDGVVDASDYTVYRDTLGSTADLRADGDESGEVDLPDLGVWQDNYGSSNTAVTVPEPASLGLLALSICLISIRSRDEA